MVKLSQGPHENLILVFVILRIFHLEDDLILFVLVKQFTFFPAMLESENRGSSQVVLLVW